MWEGLTQQAEWRPQESAFPSSGSPGTSEAHLWKSTPLSWESGRRSVILPSFIYLFFTAT